MTLHKRNTIIGLAVIAVVLGGAYFYSVRSFDVHDPVARYRAAMRQDTQGGKTPKETLRLFVAALRTGNVALASNYFLLDDNLSREKWVNRLSAIKKKDLLGRMADDIERDAKSTPPSYTGDAGYELLNKDGTVGVVIDMELNTFSGVWKLQSF